MMQLEVNGEATRLPRGTTLSQLLKQLQLTERRLAVEHNQEVIPRSEYDDLQLQDGDQVEIVHAIGGG